MKVKILTGAALGLLLGLPWLAWMALGERLAKLPVLPFDLFELITRLMPGRMITLALEGMIQVLQALQLGQTSVLGKFAEMVMAYLFSLLILGALGVTYSLVLARLQFSWLVGGLVTGLVLTALGAPLADWGGWGSAGPLPGLGWILVTSLGWGLALAWGVEQVRTAFLQKQDEGRRRALGILALGSLALSGLAIGLGRWISSDSQEELSTVITGTLPPPPPTSTLPPTQVGFIPVPGTRPELTPIDQFYRVDINLLPPDQSDLSDASSNLTKRLRAQGGDIDLPANTYVLAIDGLVERPLALDLSALKTFPYVEQYATLTCISNPVGGDLIGTTLFQGARLKDVLERASLKPGVVDIKFTCVDGYTESLPLESALDPRTLLCYAMGDQPLSQKHGAPLRLYTPDRFGMKNPKWIIHIEAIGEDYFGYWEERGWSEQAWVQITSVIDTAINASPGQAQVGGIAFAGARGISRVEISADGGAWLPVELNRPLSPLTWVLWQASLDLASGDHLITVRATGVQDELQTAEISDTHPDGATGYHSKKIIVQG